MQLKQELVEPEAMATPGLGGAMAAEPPKEAMAVADAIQSHSSFRSLVFQVERDTESHQPMLRVRVQFWRGMRVQGIKSAMSAGAGQLGNPCLGGGWICEGAKTRGRGQTKTNVLANFKASGVPESVLEKLDLPQENRIIGPWQIVQEGLPELLEILETADQPEGGQSLSEKEAKVGCICLICVMEMRTACDCRLCVH
jgi:hypothetical protein